MSIQIFIKNGMNGKSTLYDVDEKDYIINLKNKSMNNNIFCL